jgi:hypothetical protein
MTTGYVSKYLFVNGHEQLGVLIAEQLTEDASLVCKLLAINPEDLAIR